MLDKHPQSSPPPDPTPPPALLSEAAILKGVQTFPNASATGPFGLRLSHLCRHRRTSPLEVGSSRQQKRLVNLVRADNAKFVPSGKRHVTKGLATISCPFAFSTLTPLQLGVGVRDRYEAIVGAACIHPSNLCRLLLLDFSNVFNNVSQESINVRLCIPSIYSSLDGVLLLLSAYIPPRPGN